MKIILNFNDKEIIDRWKKGRPIITAIALKFDEVFFPTEHWDDFSVVILNWWLNNIIAHSQGSPVQENDFMDGPFSFRTARDGDEITISFYEDAVMTNELRMGFLEYSKAMLNAAHELLKKLRDIGIESKDIKDLKNTYNKAVQIIK